MSQGIAFARSGIIYAAIDSIGTTTNDWQGTIAQLRMPQKVIAIPQTGNATMILLTTGCLLPWSVTLAIYRGQVNSLHETANSLMDILIRQLNANNPFSFGLLLGFEGDIPVAYRINADGQQNKRPGREPLTEFRAIGEYSVVAEQADKLLRDHEEMDINSILCRVITDLCNGHYEVAPPVMKATVTATSVVIGECD
jgi:hypothetical protein